MAADALAAYAHFLTIFLAFSCLTAELILYRPAMAGEIVRRLHRIDAGYGLAGMAIVASGLLGFFLFGKGTDFYAHNGIFWLKMALVATVIAISAMPTVHFQWLSRKAAGETTSVAATIAASARCCGRRRPLLALIPLAATLIARGIGLLR
jgi:putative membrane protein